METFEFVVTSIARVALKEHVKIQAEGAAEGMLTDEPITPVIELIRNFCDNYPAKLIILTGREDTPEVRSSVYMSCFNGRMFLFSSVLHYHRQVLRN